MKTTDTRWRLAAEDLQALAWLHVRERSVEALRALAASGFPSTLSLLSADHPAVQALTQSMDPLAHDHVSAQQRCDDDLAADYAAIYLTNASRASPYESVWRDEDQLMMQEPTFAVRAFYRRHGMAVADWRCMPDDHLAHELDFVAHLLGRGAAREAARFLQQHLMTWLPDFAAAVDRRAQTRFYAALAGLTLVSCESLLTMLPVVPLMPPLVADTAMRDSAPPAGCGPG